MRQLPGELEAIFITHAHRDHAGAMHEVAKATGAPVWGSEADADALEGKAPSPRTRRTATTSSTASSPAGGRTGTRSSGGSPTARPSAGFEVSPSRATRRVRSGSGGSRTARCSAPTRCGAIEPRHGPASAGRDAGALHRPTSPSRGAASASSRRSRRARSASGTGGRSPRTRREAERVRGRPAGRAPYAVAPAPTGVSSGPTSSTTTFELVLRSTSDLNALGVGLDRREGVVVARDHGARRRSAPPPRPRRGGPSCSGRRSGRSRCRPACARAISRRSPNRPVSPRW